MTELHGGRTNDNGHKLKQKVPTSGQIFSTKGHSSIGRGCLEVTLRGDAVSLHEGLADWIKPCAIWSDFFADPALNRQLNWRPMEVSTNRIILPCDFSLGFCVTSSWPM